MTELMVVIIAKLITGDISTDTLGGPIMIAQMAGDSAKAGIGSLISFIALISVNLAIINLLPIPVLDGVVRSASRSEKSPSRSVCFF